MSCKRHPHLLHCTRYRMEKTNLKGLTLQELSEFALSIGEQKFRGKQLFDWLYTREAAEFSAMTSLSKNLRERLESRARIDAIEPAGRQTSPTDGTTKFLFRLSDGKRIESVLIPPRTAFTGPDAADEEEQGRLTLCVSTQVGCPLDCSFCATATMGFHRNLTTGEIVDQLIQVRNLTGKRITNLVYMGMGEPLLNYENVMSSVEIITTGMAIAARRITISTAGIVPAMQKMADENRKTKLAISLHSLDDESRTRLMPINARYPLARLIEAAQYYYRKTRRRVTFEYIVFDGWNDTEKDVAALTKLAKQVPCKVNIIPFHTISFTNASGFATSLRPSTPERTEEFAARLRRAHLTVFVRSSAGEDIDGACGQLAVRLERTPRPGGHSPVLVHPILHRT